MPISGLTIKPMVSGMTLNKSFNKLITVGAPSVSQLMTNEEESEHQSREKQDRQLIR